MAASEPGRPSRVALARSDIDAGLALSAGAGWNQTADDWAFFIAHGRAIGCRDAAGRLVATAAALAYGGAVGWLSMVLVAPYWRHRGLATSLLADGIQHLQAARVTPVLDATPAGEPVYRRLGFDAGFAFDRWEGEGGASIGRSPGDGGDSGEHGHRVDDGARLGDADIDALAALDARAAGVDRRRLLHDLLRRPGSRAWTARDGSGFLVSRRGHRARQIGPLVARDAAGARSLLAAALAEAEGRVFLDVPQGRRDFADALAPAGFERQRPFVRMALGPTRSLTCGEHQFVLAGPEYG